MKTIKELQDEVIEEFSDFDDWMDKYQLLIDLGNEQEPLAPVTTFIKKTVKWHYSFNSIILHFVSSVYKFLCLLPFPIVLRLILQSRIQC